MTDHKPAMVWPLSCFLAEEMEAREWDCIDVAERMPGDYALNVMMINLLLAVSEKENLKFDDDLAGRLGIAFGVSADMFLNMHRTWKDNPGARQSFDVPEHLFAGVEFPEDASGKAGSP